MYKIQQQCLTCMLQNTYKNIVVKAGAVLRSRHLGFGVTLYLTSNPEVTSKFSINKSI